MTQEVKRNYLEINSLEDLNQGSKPSDDYSVNLLDPVNFQLNKFFYKNIGNKHNWVDRLVWNEEQWINYVSSKSVETYVLTIDGNIDLSENVKTEDFKISDIELLLGIKSIYSNNLNGFFNYLYFPDVDQRI